MTTPRKEKPKSPLGPRVRGGQPQGRTVAGNEFARAIVDRVKSIRQRLVTQSRAEWQRLTRQRFATRIGLAEEALRKRLRTAKPIPFTAEELATICREFGVRPDYLFRRRTDATRRPDGRLVGRDRRVQRTSSSRAAMRKRRSSSISPRHSITISRTYSLQQQKWSRRGSRRTFPMPMIFYAPSSAALSTQLMRTLNSA